MMYARLMAGMVLGLVAAGAAAETWQCVSENGAVTYTQSTPCRGDTRDIRTPPPVRAHRVVVERGAPLWRMAKDEDTLGWAVGLIRGAGYQCDSIAATSGCSTPRNCVYRIECDRRIHVYHLVDYGGQWLVLVE